MSLPKLFGIPLGKDGRLVKDITLKKIWVPISNGPYNFDPVFKECGVMSGYYKKGIELKTNKGKNRRISYGDLRRCRMEKE